jgi:hypothetical protein
MPQTMRRPAAKCALPLPLTGTPAVRADTLPCCRAAITIEQEITR